MNTNLKIIGQNRPLFPNILLHFVYIFFHKLQEIIFFPAFCRKIREIVGPTGQAQSRILSKQILRTGDAPASKFHSAPLARNY